ncbi:hypothetical protein C8Q78DRAFT_1097700 [Trametes maxima]|nr:hypothetical protein C8Q78DRAFT_1097700 [Trametes maxima]
MNDPPSASQESSQGTPLLPNTPHNNPSPSPGPRIQSSALDGSQNYAVSFGNGPAISAQSNLQYGGFGLHGATPSPTYYGHGPRAVHSASSGGITGTMVGGPMSTGQTQGDVPRPSTMGLQNLGMTYQMQGPQQSQSPLSVGNSMSVFGTTLSMPPTPRYTPTPPSSANPNAPATMPGMQQQGSGIPAMQPPTNHILSTSSMRQSQSGIQGTLGSNIVPGSTGTDLLGGMVMQAAAPEFMPTDAERAPLPRTSMAQAVFFDTATPQEFSVTLKEMVAQMQSTSTRLAEVEARMAEQGVQVNKLMEEVEELKGILAEGAEGVQVRGDGISVNEHPTLKDAIHELAWCFIGLEDFRRSKECWKKLGELRPHEDGLAMEELEGGEIRRFYPRFDAGVNHFTNQAFIKALAGQAYDNETRFRADGSGQSQKGWKSLPDVSYNLKVMTVVAEEYWTTLARRWRERQTDEGITKRRVANEKNSSRSRRVTKNRNRTRMAHVVERLYGLEGAASLCVTDYASSQYSEDSDTITEINRERRKAQGCGRGAKVIKSRLWRRRAYVRFLRFLDYLLALEQRCQLSNLEGMSRLRQEDLAAKKRRESAKKTAGTVRGAESASDGPPAPKRARIHSGTDTDVPELSKLIKEPKNPRTMVKTTYQDAWENGDGRAPHTASKRRSGPYECMVRRSWLREYEEKTGRTIEMRTESELPWWSTFQIGDDMLLPDDVTLLAEIPDSGDEPEGETVLGV